MLTLSAFALGLILGAIGGVLAYRKNATKANAIVTAVQSPPKV